MVSGKTLLKNYIKTTYTGLTKKEKQCKVNIDYESLNNYLITETGKGFWDLHIYEYIDPINTQYHVNYNTTFTFTNVPYTVNLHDLDATYNNEWVSCKAMIKNITDTRVDLETASYICGSCGQQYLLHVTDPTQPPQIPSYCTSSDCAGTSKDMRFDKDTSIYRNYKLVKLEEPLELRTGGATREFKGILLDYLASPNCNLKAGDVVNVTGLFKVEPRKAKGRADGYEFILHVHNISPVEDVFEDSRISEEDIDDILALSGRTDIFPLLWKNLAPEIYGYENVKKGLLLQLFEGARPADDIFKTDNMDRWTIHILLIGDPGIGKSQLIQALKKRAPKIIGTSGTNASQAGLTISTVKDELTGNWSMEAGAIVLGDTGIVCIDEYDKLSPSAQKSLNEPMEQCSVSSAKAGLVQTMSARTSVVAAANPKYSKFDQYKSLKEQLDIPESNLSRFDLVFVLNDDIDVDKDTELARALLDKKYMVEDVEEIDIELFKKYVTWVKANCFPVLDEEAKVLLIDFYVNTRQAASQDNDGKPITARDLKALERLTIARAKCENRTLATAEDVLDVLEIYRESLAKLGLTPETAGALREVPSKNELSVITTIEDMIKAKIEFEGLPLSSESINGLRIECGMLCHERGMDQEGVFDIAYRNVEKSL